ncbi:hypothetical protein D3C86_1397860 [compost metagenome]
MLLDQGHPRLHRGGDVGADQSAGPGADHHQVALEALRLAPAGIHLARLEPGQQLAGQQRKHAEQDEGAEQPRREDTAQRVELAQLAPGVHVDQGARQHAELADPPEGARRQSGQAHRQIDQEKREDGHQAQGEQVEGTLLGDAPVDGGQAPTEAAAHPVAQQEAAAQHGQGGAQGGSQRHQNRAAEQAEQRAADQGQQGGAGQRQRGHRHVDQQVQSGGPPWLRGHLGIQRRLAGLERFEAEVLAEVEQEEHGDQRHDQSEQNQPARAHALPRASSPGSR